MIRLALVVSIVAALSFGAYRGVVWLREDAQADILRDLARRQAERAAQDAQELARRKEVIENEDADQLRRRACDNGWLPADACAAD